MEPTRTRRHAIDFADGTLKLQVDYWNNSLDPDSKMEAHIDHVMSVAHGAYGPAIDYLNDQIAQEDPDEGSTMHTATESMTLNDKTLRMKVVLCVNRDIEAFRLAFVTIHILAKVMPCIIMALDDDAMEQAMQREALDGSSMPSDLGGFGRRSYGHGHVFPPGADPLTNTGQYL